MGHYASRIALYYTTRNTLLSWLREIEREREEETRSFNHSIPRGTGDAVHRNTSVVSHDQPLAAKLTARRNVYAYRLWKGAIDRHRRYYRKRLRFQHTFRLATLQRYFILNNLCYTVELKKKTLFLNIDASKQKNSGNISSRLFTRELYTTKIRDV